MHFTAMVGGIFGLVLGCSVISIIEMIYFYTIRFLQYLRSSTLPHPALEETVSPQKIVKPPTLVRPYRPTTGNNEPATTDFILQCDVVRLLFEHLHYSQANPNYWIGCPENQELHEKVYELYNNFVKKRDILNNIQQSRAKHLLIIRVLLVLFKK